MWKLYRDFYTCALFIFLTPQQSGCRVDAYNRVREAMVVLGAARNVVVNCCCYGDRLGKAKIYTLRVGLDALLDMYAGRR